MVQQWRNPNQIQVGRRPLLTALQKKTGAVSLPPASMGGSMNVHRVFRIVGFVWLLTFTIMSTSVFASPESSLHKAAKKGDIQRIQKLIWSGVDINAADKRGRTALMFAVEEDRLSAVEFLIEKGADVSAMDRKNETALDKARQRGKNDTVAVLENAIRTSLPSAVVATQHPRKDTNGGIERMRRLITQGADVSAKDVNGRTALYHARFPVILELLLSNGADVNAKDEKGRTALHRVSRESSDAKARPSWEKSYVARIDALLSNGADVDAIDSAGKTALHHASYSECVACIETLLSHGANIEAKDEHGRTPLMSRDGFPYESLIALLSNGADVNAKDEKGRTAQDIYEYVDLSSIPRLGQMDQDEIGNVILTESRQGIRLAAVERLHDQDVLARIRDVLVKEAQSLGLSSTGADGNGADERAVKLIELRGRRRLRPDGSPKADIDLYDVALEEHQDKMIECQLLLLEPWIVDAFGVLTCSFDLNIESSDYTTYVTGTGRPTNYLHSETITIEIELSEIHRISETFYSRAPHMSEQFRGTGDIKTLRAIIDLSRIRNKLAALREPEIIPIPN